jgi:hypothetical protein
VPLIEHVRRLSVPFAFVVEPVEQCMSPTLTTRHHHSLRSLPRHSDPRSDGTSAWRLARLAANLGNGIIQQTPNQVPPRMKPTSQLQKRGPVRAGPGLIPEARSPGR